MTKVGPRVSIENDTETTQNSTETTQNDTEIIDFNKPTEMCDVEIDIVEPPCTERYARWCERSGDHSNPPPTRLHITFLTQTHQKRGE